MGPLANWFGYSFYSLDVSVSIAGNILTTQVGNLKEIYLQRWPESFLLKPTETGTSTKEKLCLNQVRVLLPPPPRAGNLGTYFQKLSNLSHPVKFFRQMPGPRASSGPFILMNFTIKLFCQFEDLSH